MISKILIKNIKSLVQTEEKPRLKVSGKDMSNVDCIDNAFLLLQNDLIQDFGQMTDLTK